MHACGHDLSKNQLRIWDLLGVCKLMKLGNDGGSSVPGGNGILL